MFNDDPPAVPSGLFPCRRWNTYIQSVMHDDNLGGGEYLRSMFFVMLLPVSSILVLFISIFDISVMLVLIPHVVVAVGMRL